MHSIPDIGPLHQAVQRRLADGRVRVRIAVVAALSAIGVPVAMHGQNLAPTYRPLPTARNDSIRAQIRQVESRLQTINGQLDNAIAALRSAGATDRFIADKLLDSIRFAGDAQRALNARAQDSVMADSRGEFVVRMRTRVAERRDQARVASDSLSSAPTAADSIRLIAERDAKLQAALENEQDAMREDRQIEALRSRMRDSLGAVTRHRDAALRAGNDARQLQGRGYDRSLFVRDSGLLAAVADTLKQERRQLESDLKAIVLVAARRLLPVRSRSEAERFFGRPGVDIGRNVLISAGVDGRAATAFAEFAAMYLSAVRLGMGVVVADASAVGRKGADAAGDALASGTSDRAAVARFLAGGGNLNATAAMPLLFLKDSAQKHTLTLQFGGRGAFDLTGVDGATTITNPLGDAGFDAFGTIFANVPYFVRGACAGGNAAFVLASTGRTQAKGFCYAQLTAGFDVPGLGRVVASWSGGPTPLRRPLTVTVQPAFAR